MAAAAATAVMIVRVVMGVFPLQRSLS
jgi:hypothetical protein